MSFPSGAHQSDADLIPTYTVCIIGDPRSGKSCFCNRFVYSHPDWYQEGHPSVLSEVEFRKPVVNSDHWLYWGTVTRRLDDETSVRFCVIEQTEFISDATSLPFSPKSPSIPSNSCSVSYSSHSTNAVTVSGISSTTNFAPFLFKDLHSSNRLHDYILRSTATKVCSPGKLRYYCIDQIGHEERYKQEYFPHMGPLEVHGFLVIYDVSRRASCHDVPNLQQQQLTFLTDILSLISKRKKPVVVVTAKRDIVDEQCLSNVTQFLQKSADFRKIPLVEASAHRNINVELAFLTLARLLENSSNSSKSRSAKLKLLSYQEATREQDEHQRRLREAFVNRVSLSPAGFLTDWPTFLSRYSHQGDVARFIDLWGSDVARETFEQFTAQRKTETKRRHMAKLPEALSTMLLYVGPVTNKSPKELLQRLRAHSRFDQFFVSEELTDDKSIQRCSTRRNFQGDDSRIPFALAIKEPPDNGDSPFIESLKSLVFAESWATNMSIFEESLLKCQANSNASDCFASILPGQSFDHEQLSRVQPTSVLSQEDQLEVYQKFQECLRLNTREEFLDLLLESLPQFIRAASAYLNCLGDTFFAMASSSFRQVPPNTAPQPRSEPNRSRPISPVSEPLTIPLRSVQLPPADIRLCAVLAPPRGAKEQQLGIIKNCIASDSRYHAMDYMPSERQTCLAGHLDILLHRVSQTEASTLLLPRGTIHRHYSCSFMNQQDSLQLTFPLPHCPAYQTDRCIDAVFESLCSSTEWSVGEAQNSFSSHLSCVLGQGDKRLSVAVCAVCTDVVAANAGINLFRAAGFVPEGVTSPSLLTSPSSPSRATQNLVCSWPLASTILTPVDTLLTSVIGDSVISPVLGTVQASFLSHHELLALAINPRRSPDVFDGVILLLSADEAIPTSYSAFPPCTCGEVAAATYCCKCYRGASDCSHTTPRPRSFFSRATAIKALAEHLAPMPHLIVLAVSGTNDSAKMNICHGTGNLSTLPFCSTAESSPQTPIADARLNDWLVDGTKTSVSKEEAEDGNVNKPILGGVFHPAAKLQPNFVLDALSSFLSACWTRKLASGEGGRRRSRKTISPKARDSGEGSHGTIYEGRFHPAPLPGRLHSHHRRCHRHYYHSRHHLHRHHHHRHHHFYRCSRTATSNSSGGGAFRTSETSSTSSPMGSNYRPPKLTLTLAPSISPRGRYGRSCSPPVPSNIPLKQLRFFDQDPSGGSRLRSRPDECSTIVEITTAKSNRLSHHLHSLTSTLDPPTGYCSSIASSCSPCPAASSFPSLIPFAYDKASSVSSIEPVFLKFSEGLSPLPPDDIDPATPLHVLSLTGRRRRRRRNEAGWLQRKNEGKDGVEEEKWENEEIFHTTDDALQFGTVLLVPCPHIHRSADNLPPNSQGWTAPTIPYHSMVKQHPSGKKGIDLGLANKGGLNQHHHNYNQQHQTNAGGAILTTTSVGGGVSSFLTSGIRAVTSGFARPRERRRSVSTPCGGEAPLPFASTTTNEMAVVGGGAATVTSASNTPSSSTPGSSRAADLGFACMPPGLETPLHTGTGISGRYTTETAFKASTPSLPFEEMDGLGGGGGLAAGGEFLPPRLWVSSLNQLMQLASASRSSSGGEREVAVAGAKRRMLTPQLRHWHLPSCPHRLCIPRQNLPPPPPPSLSSLSTSRRHPTSNTNPSSSSTKPLEEYSSFRPSYNNHHHCQTDVIAAPPPESRHLPANTTEQSYSTSQHRVRRRQQPQLSTASLSGFPGGRRSVVDLPTSSAYLDAGQGDCSNPPTSSQSTTCLAAAAAPSRLSPPLTLVPFSKLSTGISGTSGRRNRRNVLSLFGGKTNASLSEPQPPQNNTHTSTSAALSGGSAGASFPSTPVHEPSTVTTITAPATLAFGYLKAKSITPPLSTAASSPRSSSVTNTTNTSG
uniref:Rho GTPase activating protein 190 n=1 Tax=Echinococcus granulosus TaxID=6210 RepID=A0A068WAZ4_ECHGR|nr:rho GTPase activating protein 190 [Echinococcus granulosus]